MSLYELYWISVEMYHNPHASSDTMRSCSLHILAGADWAVLCVLVHYAFSAQK